MKQIGFSLMLFVIVLSPLAAACQGSPGTVPDAPEPVPGAAGAPSDSQLDQEAPPANPQISDREWQKIQNILHGERVIVASTYGSPLRCRFANATDTMLYCDAPGSPDGTGYRIERATVIYVEMEAPPRPVNHHPAWISSMIAGGVLVGLAATHNTDDGRAAADGVIGALIVGAIGAPMAFMNQDSGPPSPVIYGTHAMVGIRVSGFRIPHRRLSIPR